MLVVSVVGSVCAVQGCEVEDLVGSGVGQLVVGRDVGHWGDPP